MCHTAGFSQTYIFLNIDTLRNLTITNQTFRLYFSQLQNQAIIVYIPDVFNGLNYLNMSLCVLPSHTDVFTNVQMVDGFPRGTDP